MEITSEGVYTAMTDRLSQAREDLVSANRILANEGILDAFGHVSVRHPEDPNLFLLSRARSPEVIEDSDLLEHGLDGEPWYLEAPFRIWNALSTRPSMKR